MGDINKTTAAFLNLNLEVIPDEWVSTVWMHEFIDIPAIPVEVKRFLQDNNALCDTLSQLHDVLQPWARARHTSADQSFWVVLSDSDISIKHVMVALYHIIDFGQGKSAAVVNRLSASVAAGIYFLLLHIPGSRAFKIFSNEVFDRSIQVFKTLTVVETTGKNKRPNITNSQQGRVNKRRRKQGKATTALVDDMDVFDDDVESDDNEEAEQVALRPQDLSRLHQSCVGLLQDFVRLLESSQCLDTEESCCKVINVLLELSRSDPGNWKGMFDPNVSVESIDTIAQLAFMGLRMICQTKQLGIIVNVLKQLRPSLLMFVGQNAAVASTGAIPAAVVAARDQAIAFICWLMKHADVDGLLKAVRTLIQAVCMKVPDRTEYRSKVSEGVVTLLKELPVAEYAINVQWMFRYSKNAKMSYRVFGLDIIAALLNEPERTDDKNEVAVDLQCYLTHSHLLQFVIERCSDLAPSVRSRAIVAFDQCSGNPHVAGLVRNIVTPQVTSRPPAPKLFVKTPGHCQRVDSPATHSPAPQSVNSIEMESMDHDLAGHMATIALTSDAEISLEDSAGVVSMLRRRSGDEKINVRKSALQALENLIRLEGDHFNDLNLNILRDRCRDPAVSVRKQALQSLSDLLHSFPLSQSIQKAWLAGVLPMVLDAETAVQTKCLELISLAIFDNITSYERSRSDACKLSWSLLNHLADVDNTKLCRFFQKTCHLRGKAGSVPPSMFTAIRSHVGTENNAGAWLLLSELVPFMKNCNAGFMLDYWQNHRTVSHDDAAANATMVRVLTTLSRVAEIIGSDGRNLLIDDLKQQVMRFDSSPDLIAAIVNTLHAMASSADDSKAATDSWFGEVLRMCDSYLSKVILTADPDAPFDENEVVRHLFTLGEIAQLCPSLTPTRAFMLVQSLVAAPTITSLDGSSQQQVSLQPSQSQSASQQSSQPVVFSQFRGSTASPRVRAMAFLTLGKLCLQNENIAKTCVPALARELEVSTDMSVRNNVIVVMCDLCVRYTALVDCYVPCIASCLRDDSPLIRRQTLTLLTHLLQEDYLKWKGCLFYRFVMSIVDDDEGIQEFAHFCLIHLLIQRSPSLFFNHFVEAMFYFNSYEDHPVYNKFSESERDKKLFSLKGRSCSGKRMRIYRLMLEHMTDEQRFNLMSKLIQEVLVAVVDEVLPMNAATSALLQDTFACLACKEIKLSALRARPVDEVAETEQEMAAVVMNAAKKTLISQVMKKAVMETTIPVMVSLKHMLEKQHSPVMRDLMMCLHEIMKDYKNEIKDILAADKQLANEIEFDLRKFDEQQKELLKKQQQQQARASLANSPLASKGVASLQATPTLSPGTRSPVPAAAQAMVTRSEVPAAVIGPEPVLAISATPAPRLRPMPLSTLAIINSARKAVERAKLNSSVSSPATPLTANRLTPVRRIQANTAATAAGTRTVTTESESDDGLVRAVSTPTAEQMSLDITFANNLSVIPVSPALTCNKLRKRINSRKHCGELMEDGEELDLGGDNMPVVHLQSLDAAVAKPRTWNICLPGTNGAVGCDVEMVASDDQQQQQLTDAAADIAKENKKTRVRQSSKQNQAAATGADALPNGGIDDNTTSVFESLDNDANPKRLRTASPGVAVENGNKLGEIAGDTANGSSVVHRGRRQKSNKK